MEKLIDKFEDIVSNNIICDLGECYGWKAAPICAEECKQVAIEFVTYIHTVGYMKVKENESWDIYTKEELFNKFIEEEYGK